jgi:hypothetical protein
MNNINKNNYEAFLLDYVEGNLSAELIAELLLFIAQHPELDVDLNGVTEAIVEPENFQLHNKSQFHQVNEAIVEKFQILAVLVLDQEANAEEKKQYDQLMLQYPLLENHFAQLKKTVSISEQSIVFPFKDSLYNIPDTRTAFEHLAVADLEGQNDEIAKKQLAQLLKDSPLFKKENIAFQHTVLKADKDIIFGDKSELKKVVFIPSYWSRNWKTAVSGFAAVLLVAFSLFSLFNANEQTSFAMSIEDLSTSKLMSNKKAFVYSTSSIEQNRLADIETISKDKKEISGSNPTQITSIPSVQIETLSPILMKQLPFKDDLYVGILADQINPVDMSIKLYPEDGILENETPNSEILKLKNLALKQLNKAVGAPEEKGWTGNDIAQSLEQAFNGAVRIQNEKEEKRQTFGFSIGNFSYERSRGR